MTITAPVVTLSPRDYDAFLFDLDGVLTKTASVHAVAWKKLFDGFLQERAARTGEAFLPFDIDADYRRYVDGKPRYDGVAAFLESRGIELPLGTAEDGPGEQTVHGLGNLKDQYFTRHLAQQGVEVYDATIALVRTLRAQEIKTAVVSSSINCAAVLEAAGLAQMFDARVDGRDITRLGLDGKPAPDAFLEAARRLKVDPSRAVVVEDAIAGVEAGRAGRFGLVIGVDRIGQSQALRQAGADPVVTDLAQVKIAVELPSAWSLVYEGFDPAHEGIRESLCALGNGYFTTRAAMAWAVMDDVHYPGTYRACGYNRLRTDIAGRVVENEDLVNLPNWLVLEFRIADGDWFDARTVKILSYHQELDLRRGMLLRTLRFEDRQVASVRSRSAAWCRWLKCTWARWRWPLPPRTGPQRSRSVRPSMDGSSTRVRSFIADSITNTWSRCQARLLARTACICWCAPANLISMSRRPPELKPL